MAALTQTPCSHILPPTELSYFTSACSLVLLIVTVIGNMLIVFSVYKDPQKRLRTPYMFLLVNLAFTDLVVGSITLPISVAVHYLEALGTKKDGHVIVSRLVYFISCTASLLNLVAFCVDRYIAVKWPFKYRQMLNSKVCLFIAISIWVTAICIASLYFVFGFINYLFVFAHVSVILALAICAITLRLLQRLNKASKERQEIMNQTATKGVRKSDKRVTKLFIIILIMFLACYTPPITFMYILKFCPQCHCNFRHVLRDLQFLFIAANSAINPYVCAMRLKPFRNALRSIFTFELEDDDFFDDEFCPRSRSITERVAASIRRSFYKAHSSTINLYLNEIPDDGIKDEEIKITNLEKTEYLKMNSLCVTDPFLRRADTVR